MAVVTYVAHTSAVVVVDGLPNVVPEEHTDVQDIPRVVQKAVLNEEDSLAGAQ